jgi:LytR cell envelope-related transcriptional attenuator
MGPVPFALSVHNFINSVGADAGFASIIGLAILVLLFFAQARETSTLRDSLERADQQIGSLDARLAAVARNQAAAAQATIPPTLPPVAVRPTGGAVRQAANPVASAVAGATGGGQLPGQRPGVAVPIPVAPAGLGAPSMGAATKLIADPAPPAIAPGTQVPVIATAPATAAAARASTASAPSPAGDATVIAPPPPVPATAGASGNGHSAVGTAPPAPPAQSLPPRVQLHTGPAAGVAAVAGAPAAAQAGAASSRRGSGGRPPTQRRQTGGPSFLSRLVPWLIGLAALAIAVVALLIVTGGVGGKSKTTAAGGTSAAKTTTRAAKHHKSVVFSAASVTVAVLNGTDVTHLAKDVAGDLSGAGYNVPTALVTNAAEQTHATTIVAYLPHQQQDAAHVAAALKLSSSAVQPIDQGTLQVACPPGTSCPANVVVTIGQDLASDASNTSSTSTT